MTNHSAHRSRGKPLGTPELIAIALGGMIGGGIFTILGISVEMIGSLTLLAMTALGIGALLILYFKFHHNTQQLVFIIAIYALLTAASWLYSGSK